MAPIASELLVERLIDWGVDTVFGLPGDGINGIMEALPRHEDRIRFVPVHHEEAAAVMATGYAKSTGRLGVCLATSGPGGIHLLNGLYDAKLDHLARPGHHRDAGDPAAGDRLPAGGPPREAVRGRGRLRRHGPRPDPDPHAGRPGCAPRPGRPHRLAHHLPQRPPGGRRRRQPLGGGGARPRTGDGTRVRPSPRPAPDPRPGAGRRCAQRGDGRRHARGRGCAPSLHLHPACAVPNIRHVEYFADHVRVDHLLFAGVIEPKGARSNRTSRVPAWVST